MADRQSTTSTKGGATYDELIKGAVDPYYSFNLVDLADRRTGNVVPLQEGVNTLVRQIDQTFADIEAQQQDKKIDSFIIGKSHARQAKAGGGGYSKSYTKSYKEFDRLNPNTWSLDDGVNGRWRKQYDKDGYSGLIAITAVTTDIIPGHVKDAHPNLINAEMLALALEQQLIHYYMLERGDPRLGNTSFDPGNLCKTPPYAGIVYVAYKLKDR
ncbi:uncharacterized protein [Amphiura filiformis]|uniref:uncharacterized protein n=1 Tax=Amphiura filiformis TaxID=82378 RepID=UPI003B223411